MLFKSTHKDTYENFLRDHAIQIFVLLLNFINWHTSLKLFRPLYFPIYLGTWESQG